MNVDEKYVARILALKEQTLRNWRHLRKGPPYIKLSRNVRYNLEDIEKYLEKHRVVPEKD